MLRISVEKKPDTLSLILEGRLVGPWVGELRKVYTEHDPQGNNLQVTVDLAGLTAMDEAGQALLDELLQRGATLRCSDVMNQYLVEQMARPAGTVLESCRPCQRVDSEAEEKVFVVSAKAG